MPPTFAFVMLWGAYLAAAAIGIGVCLAASVLPAWRPFALRVAGGIVASIPGVIILQAFAVPVLALVFALFWVVSRLIGPLDGAAQIAWNLTVIIAFLAIPSILSVIGFTVGWGIGVRMARGATLKRALDGSRLISAAAARVGVFRSRPL
jgi:hypothetical protein